MPTHTDLSRNTDPAQEEASPRATPGPKRPSLQAHPTQANPDTPSEDDGHLGATEEQVSETPAPAGEAFEDDPKQG